MILFQCNIKNNENYNIDKLQCKINDTNMLLSFLICINSHDINNWFKVYNLTTRLKLFILNLRDRYNNNDEIQYKNHKDYKEFHEIISNENIINLTNITITIESVKFYYYFNKNIILKKINIMITNDLKKEQNITIYTTYFNETTNSIYILNKELLELYSIYNS